MGEKPAGAPDILSDTPAAEWARSLRRSWAVLGALPLVDHAGSAVRESAELPGGHASLFAGRQAATRLWPALAKWFADDGVT